LNFKTKISCKLLRITTDTVVERKFWQEKFELFGLKNIAEIIKNGCVSKIRGELLKIKGVEKKILAKPWTRIEQLVIKSWLQGYLKNEKMEG